MKNPSQQRTPQAAMLLAVTRVLGILMRAGIALLLAYRFGAGSTTDAFWVAQTLPLNLVAWLGPVLKVSVIPGLTEIRLRDGVERARAAAGELIGASLTYFTAATVLITALAPALMWAMAPGFRYGGETHAQATMLARLLAPALLLAGMFEVAETVLNAERHFRRPAMGRFLSKAGTMAGLLFLAVPFGMPGVVVGVIVGMVAQLVPTLPLLRGAAPGFHRPRWRLSPELRSCWILLGPALLWLAIDQVNIIVDRMFASTLGVGKLSALTYALRVIEPPIAVASALITASLPSFSEHRAQGRPEEAGRLVGISLRMLLFLTLPATVGLAMMHRPIIAAFMERGSFDAQATTDTAAALIGYAVGLIFIAINMLCRVVLFTGGRVKTVLRLGIFEVVLNAILDATLMWLMGITGVALATSVSAFVMSFFFLRAVIRGEGQPVDRALGITAAKTVAATAVMAGFVMGTGRLLANHRWESLPEERLIEATLVILAGALSYAGAAALLRTEEMRRMTALVGRKGRRNR